MRQRKRVPTWTTLVTTALSDSKALSIPQLAYQTGGTLNQIQAAVWHLIHMGAVSMVAGKRIMKFRLTPWKDQRRYEVPWRMQELPGSRSIAGRVRPSRRFWCE